MSKEEKRRFSRAVGLRLCALRQSLGYETPAAFARVLGYPPRNYLAHERGERTQNAAVTWFGITVADRTGVSLDWLWWGKNHRPRWGQPQSATGARVVISPGSWNSPSREPPDAA